ncbi:MAG: MarR family transcriptional regulator [Chloroflexi bacterium]|nr:MarR family transcriptional regulator [Chloroflexota bacterium]
MTDADLRTMTIDVRLLAAVIARRMSGASREQLQAKGITLSGLQHAILRSLERQPMTSSDLSRRFVLDPSTLVPVITTLESKGLIERGSDPNDRRRVPLSLTEEGVALLAQIPLMPDDDPLLLSLSAMGEDRARQLIDLLREVIQHLPNGDELLADMQSHAQVYQARHERATQPSDDPSSSP